MKYQDDELVMISALQHYLFCPMMFLQAMQMAKKDSGI